MYMHGSKKPEVLPSICRFFQEKYDCIGDRNYTQAVFLAP